MNCINFVVPMNIATTKLIQCRVVEKAENKAFCGLCGFGFSFFESVSVCREQLRFLILHHFLTIAVIVKRFKRGICVYKERGRKKIYGTEDLF